MSFHAFRHTHASILIRAGVDILTVSRRLGHANTSITLNIYGHLMVDLDEALADLAHQDSGDIVKMAMDGVIIPTREQPNGSGPITWISLTVDDEELVFAVTGSWREGAEPVK